MARYVALLSMLALLRTTRIRARARSLTSLARPRLATVVDASPASVAKASQFLVSGGAHADSDSIN